MRRISAMTVRARGAEPTAAAATRPPYWLGPQAGLAAGRTVRLRAAGTGDRAAAVARPGGAARTPVLPRSLPSLRLRQASRGRLRWAASGTRRRVLESRIGGRWLLYVGTAARAGHRFFVKYAFDNDWIDATGRVLIGAAAGLAMVACGDRLAAPGLCLFGQILAGGGFSALYISVYAALVFYGLIGRPAAFGLMVLITAGAALAADLHRSQGLALFAVAGGFLTPFLVGGGENAQVSLLTYDAILAVGTMPWLSAARGPSSTSSATSSSSSPSPAGPTGSTRLRSGSDAGVPLRVRRAVHRHRHPRAARGGELTDVAGVLLLTAPLVFHAASVANLQPHWMALLVYLTLVSVAGARPA